MSLSRQARIAILGVAGALAVFSGALAQEGRDELKQRWEAMSRAERSRFHDNLKRWEAMGDDEKALMQRRFDRFKSVRATVPDSLDETERRTIDDLGPRARRKALEDKTVELLRRRHDRLPPEVRQRMRRELRSAPARDRQRRMREIVDQETSARLGRSLRRFLDSGRLDRREAKRVEQALKGRRPTERFKALHALMVRNPDLFGIPESMLDRLKRAESPIAAVRVLEQINRRGPRASDRATDRASDGASDRALGRMGRMREHLKKHGVPEEEIQEVISADPNEREKLLRDLRRKYEVPLAGSGGR